MMEDTSLRNGANGDRHWSNGPVSADHCPQVSKVADLLDGVTFNIDVQGVFCTMRPLGSTLADSLALCLASIDL